jgi:hypothetical protein
VDLISRIVEVGAFIFDLGGGAGDAKAMGKARGDITLPEILCRQRGDHPVEEGGRTSPDIDYHIENLALDYPDQLPLRPSLLCMQPANGAIDRARLIILHKGRGDTVVPILLQVIGFQEKSSAISEDVWRDDDHTRE